MVATQPVMAKDQENQRPHLKMTLSSGVVDIELRPDLAPGHVERITTLAKQGFYNGVVFHRVIEGFMAQTGDPTGTGRGGSSLPDLKAEFSNESHTRGVVSMARRGDSVDSANSQFFIVFGDARFLDHEYTVFGRVVSGMEHVDAIKKGARDTGAVVDPDKIITLEVVS